MSNRPTKPDDRAARIITRVVDLEMTPSGRWLLVDERTGLVATALKDHGCTVDLWHRFAGPWTDSATASPPKGPFDGAILRSPRTRDAHRYAVERIAAELKPNAPLLVAGCNDEGIKKLPDGLKGVHNAETLDTKFHARVWRLTRSEEPVRSQVEPFLTPVTLTLGPEPAALHTAPGIFAKGGLDDGSALLLKALGTHAHPVTTALDFGCGIGVLVAGVHAKWPEAQITALDADALAIEAFRKSFPDVQSAVGDGWQAFTRLSRPKAGYDLIVSNPPLHRATNTFDPSVMDSLIARSPDYLAPGGHLLFVTQRQRAVTRALESALGPATLLAESGRFRVWSVRKPE